MDTIHLETSLGVYLRQLRQARGQTLDAVAGKVGIKTTYLSMLELGQRTPSIGLIYSLAGYYGVPALNMLTMINTLPDRFIHDLKEQVKELLAVERLRNMVAIVMGGKCRGMSTGEILDYLAVNHPENFRIIYCRMIERFSELQDLAPREAILAGLEKDISPGEALVLNETPLQSLPSLEPPEVIKAVKEELDLTWQQVGGLLGVSGREPPRWANREVPIPEKVVRRLGFFMSKIMPRVEADIRPIARISLGSNALSPGVIFAEIEELGLAEEIKDRFIKNEPDIERFRNRPLSEFFIERAKRKLTTRETIEIEPNGRRRGAKKKDVLRGLYKQRMVTEARWRLSGQAKGVNQAKTMRSKMPVSAKRTGGAVRGQGQKYKKGAASRKESGSDSDSGADGEPPGPENAEASQSVGRQGLTRRVSKSKRRSGLYKRPGSKNWWFRRRFRHLGEKGYQVRFSTGKTNIGEAHAEVSRRLALMGLLDTGNGSPCGLPKPMPKSMTLGKLVDEHSKTVCPRRNTPTTLERYLLSAKFLSEFFGGECPLSQVTTPRLSEYLDWRQQNSRKAVLQPTTLNRDMAYARLLFNYAIGEGYCTRNPVKKFLFAREDNARTRVMFEDEMGKILPAVSVPGREQMRMAFLIGTYAPERRAALVNLLRKNVDLINRMLFFEKTKSGKPNNIPINDILFPEIKKYIEERKFAPTDRLFPDLTPDKITGAFRRITKKLGIEGLRFHDLRRTANSIMRRKGEDPDLTKEILGQSSVEINKEYYTAWNEDDKRKAVDKINIGKELLEGGQVEDDPTAITYEI